MDPRSPDPLSGVLFGVMLAAALGAPLLSMALLALYRRAVVRGMGGSGSSPPAPPPVAPAGAAAAIAVETIGARPLRSLGPEAAWLRLRVRRAVAHAAGLELIGGLAYAAVLSASWSAASGTPGALGRYLALGAVFAWPGVLAALFVAASTWRGAGSLLGGYALVTLAAWTVAAVRNPGLAILDLPLLWLTLNGLPSVLLLGFLSARVRAVGPIVLLALLLLVAGAQAALGLLAASEAAQRAVVEIAVRLGLGGTASFLGVAIAGLAVFAIGAAAALAAIRRAYLAKRLSDQSLSLHALWLTFACAQGFTLLLEGRRWLLVVPAAYLARTLAVGLLRRLPGAAPAGSSVKLLLLRVFALGPRSARQFGAVQRFWRHVGSMQMIAGPDLATQTLEPHELLAFASGRLRRLFVDGPDAAERRVAEMDLRPDRDGRFRVNDFLCREDAWRDTLARLVGASDVVLMDLRGFGREHAGCLHELRELVARVPLERVVIATDADTDAPFLEAALREAAGAMPDDSPNRAASRRAGAPPRVTVVRQSGSDRDFPQLLRCLCAAATSCALPEPSDTR